MEDLRHTWMEGRPGDDDGGAVTGEGEEDEGFHPPPPFRATGCMPFTKTVPSCLSSTDMWEQNVHLSYLTQLLW